MTTSALYNNMIQEYITDKMLMADFIKRDWLLSNIEINMGWHGGSDGGAKVVAFEKSSPSSVSFGSLPALGDISSSSFLRGNLYQKEVWGSIVINERDLVSHDGAKIPETTFLKLVPNEVDKMMQYMKEVVSTQLLGSAHFATLLTNGTAGGQFEVDNINRFKIDQKFSLVDGNTASADYYVTAIDINTRTVTGSKGTITASATRGGPAADLSAYTVAQAAKTYHAGVQAGEAFTSLPSVLLSQANGGSSTVYGVSKSGTSGFYTQCLNLSGASVSSSNILDKIFSYYIELRSMGLGKATKVVIPYSHMAAVMKLLEAQKGPYMVTKSASQPLYGWSSVTINSIQAELELVAVLEADSDKWMYLDLSGISFETNTGFKKRISPDGKAFFEVRATSGFSYVTDIACYGNLEVRSPCNNLVVYGIPAI